MTHPCLTWQPAALRAGSYTARSRLPAHCWPNRQHSMSRWPGCAQPTSLRARDSQPAMPHGMIARQDGAACRYWLTGAVYCRSESAVCKLHSRAIAVLGVNQGGREPGEAHSLSATRKVGEHLRCPEAWLVLQADAAASREGEGNGEGKRGNGARAERQ